MCSCANNRTVKTAQVIEGQRKSRLPDSLNRKWETGTDLSASGIAPVNWKLDADFDKEIIFVSADGNNLRLIPVFKFTEGTEENIYRVSTGDSSLDILISQKGCTNSETDNLKKSVQVKLGNSLYTGCGQYLYNNQLNDVWELQSINNQPLNKNDFNKTQPYLYIQLEKQQIEGFDGCGKIKGNIMVKGSRIKISGMQNTEPCNSTRIRNIFSTLLNNKLVDYRLTKNMLQLYLEDDSKLEFTRKAL